VSVRSTSASADSATASPLLTAEILSVGSELTVGETRDTNAGELARELSDAGVAVVRLTGLPDNLDVVADAFRQATTRADLTVSTGGLGPTPDDLTREAIAAVCDETPAVDDRLEAWLRELWFRRGMPFPEINLKQAWLIPSAAAIPNRNGTAPGWWVERPHGRVIVALPGPPREMRPMWRDAVLPRLLERGLGVERVTRTLRLWGIGESQVADLIGEAVLRAANPAVATYARSDSVDVRISAVGEGARDAATIAAETEASIRAVLGDYVWATGNVAWPEAIGRALADLDWSLAATEFGTGGSFAALCGELTSLVRTTTTGAAGKLPPDDEVTVSELADALRRDSGADVGLAICARPRGGDTSVVVAVSSPEGSIVERRVVFGGGPQGRGRAALTGASILLQQLTRTAGQAPSESVARQAERVR
jgi:nicotinamide-nucleotide amidase